MSRRRRFLAVAGAVSAVALWRKLIWPVVTGLPGQMDERDEPRALSGPDLIDYWYG